MDITTVLIANRGEIALRVMRACKELGLRTIAVYSEADRHAPHVSYADAAYLLGPPPAVQSYLNIEQLIDIARESGAHAIHPGYGFLSENATFAQACTDAGLVFVGPPPDAIARMGDKAAARREAVAAGVPIVPGTLHPVQTIAEIRDFADQYGYPVAIKAVGGGGGRGLRVVKAAPELEAAFEGARREAAAAFKNAEVYVEKYLTDPRHIEIQVLADSHGHVIHLGERDCSIQRRHQKLVEESPSPVISTEIREKMGAAAVALAQSVGYIGAGTLEFLFQDGEFYFLEMNTRIQVEHTVTEMVTGIDLVQAQLRVARGEHLWLTQEQVVWRGHAIECRINAEDPGAEFRPVLGTLAKYIEPVGFGVRVDSGVASGYTIPQYYDSLLAKLVVWGNDRSEAIARMRRALTDYRIDGVPTTLPFHKLVMDHPVFVRGEATVNMIPHHLAEQLSKLPSAAQSEMQQDIEPARMFEVEVNGRRFSVRVAETGQPCTTKRFNQPSSTPARRASALKTPPSSNGVASSLQGTVVAVRATPGQTVDAGQVLFVIEAMKMENEISAPHSGTLAEVRVQVGQVVEPGMLLATFSPENGKA